jgi:hypothetical protein
MAYNLMFSNATAANILSTADLNITAGEVYGSSNLTLKTYNTGDILLKAASGNIWVDEDTFGIGTTAPEATLDVAGFIRSTGLGAVVPSTGVGLHMFYHNSLGRGIVQAYDSDTSNYKPLDLEGSQIYLNIGSTGSVGINVTNPTEKLEVGGRIKVGTGSSDSEILSGYNVYNKIALGAAGFEQYSYLSTAYFLDQDNNDSTENFRLLTNAGTKELLRVDAEGRMGIGYTNPFTQLTISGTTPQITILANNTSWGKNGISLQSMQTGTNSGYVNIGQNVYWTGTSWANINVAQGSMIMSIPNGGTTPSSNQFNLLWGTAPGGTITSWKSLMSLRADYSVYIPGIAYSSIPGATVVVGAGGQLGVASSSRIYKENIESVTDLTSEKIYSLNPVSFNYIGYTGNDYYGLIAEEVYEVLPEIVTYNAEGQIFSVAYEKLWPLVLKETQKHEVDINDLQDRVLTLEQELLVATGQTTESTQTPEGILAEMQTLYEEIKTFFTALGIRKDVESGDLVVESDMSILGDATLANLTASGDVTIGTMMINSLENSFNVMGSPCFTPEMCQLNTLYLQKGLAGNLDIMDGKVIIDTSGNLTTTGTVKATKYEVETTIENASAGKITIGTGNISVQVQTAALTPDSLIMVTPEEPVIVGGKKIGDTTFEIKLQSPAAQDIAISWWIIN